jgi:hypothetical protein
LGVAHITKDGENFFAISKKSGNASAENSANCRAGRSTIYYLRNQTRFGLLRRQTNVFFGYNLYLVCGENSIIHAFDFIPASVCGVNYLEDVKYAFKNCGLLGDKGYIGADYELNLFNQPKLN